MHQVGIWIDKRQAKIVSIKNGEATMSVVSSEIEEFNPKGGSGTKFKGGPQDVVQDSRYLNREKQQIADFFREVIHRVENVDALVIFGPAKTGAGLYAAIQDQLPELHQKTSPVEKADSMTDNQIAAWVREFFQSA